MSALRTVSGLCEPGKWLKRGGMRKNRPSSGKFDVTARSPDRTVSVEYSGVWGDYDFTMLKLFRRSCAVPGLIACLITISRAQQPAPQPADDYVRTHYTK